MVESLAAEMLRHGPLLGEGMPPLLSTMPVLGVY